MLIYCKFQYFGKFKLNFISINCLQSKELNLIITSAFRLNMFKKSDPWETGLKMVSKFLGFDHQQETNQNKVIPKSNGLISFKSNNQMPVFHKSQQKNLLLKQKWKRLMKFPSKIKYQQIIQLLREGSTMEDQIWIWMLRNSQKISPQLYTSKKEQLHEIIYPKSSYGEKMKFTEMNFQIQDFEQPLQLKICLKQSIKQGKKRKVSITKSGIYLKNQSGLTGRMSLNSQASTFNSQSTESNQINRNQGRNDNNKEGLMFSSMLCSNQSQPQSNKLMKSSMMSCYSTPTQQQSSESNQNDTINSASPLLYLPSTINHSVLTDIIGSFLLHRQDFSYSITLFNIAATLYYYTNSNEMKTFILLNHIACSQFFLHYLTRDYQLSGQILQFISHKIRANCPSVVFLKNFKLQNFIQNWLYGFFYSICQNGTEVKQKIMGYLLANTFSVDSIAKVCQSLIFSLARIINQGYQDRIYQCLQNPKLYIDKQVLYDHLFQNHE